MAALQPSGGHTAIGSRRDRLRPAPHRAAPTGLTDDQAAAYQQAADTLDTNPVDDVTVLGRHFRVTRIETLLRMDASGPEMPRPSDPDPDQPPARIASAKTSNGNTIGPGQPPNRPPPPAELRLPSVSRRLFGGRRAAGVFFTGLLSCEPSAREERYMRVIWINGAFGAGKTILSSG